MKQKFEQYTHIDKIETPSKYEFNREYGHKALPVLITGLMDNWKATDLWTPDFFKDNAGEFEESASRNTNSGDKRKFTVADYFHYMYTTADADPYYLKNCQFHLKTDMTQHYQVPSYFENCLQLMADKLPLSFHLSWMYIGAKNTFSGLHLDIFNTSAWNAVISGRKIWVFYPSDQAKFLYDGKVDPFHPDLEKFPNFQYARPLICIQNPGEVVYTPSGWWHAVYNEEAGVSLTENFINETNYDVVKMTLLYHSKTEEAKFVDMCMKMMQTKALTYES